LLTFPIAEVDFHQACIKYRRRVQSFGKATRAAQWTGNDPCVVWQQRAKSTRNGQWIFAVDIELTVTDACFKQRTRMANQEYLHNSPQ
jgi:hypothetical protein